MTWLIHGAVSNERMEDLDRLLSEKSKTGFDPNENFEVFFEAFNLLAAKGQWTHLARMFEIAPEDYQERCRDSAWDSAVERDDPAVFQHFDFHDMPLKAASLSSLDAKFMFLGAQKFIPQTLAGTLSQKSTAGWLLRLAAHISSPQARSMLDHLEQHYPEDAPTMRHIAWQQAIEKEDVRALQNFLIADIPLRDPNRLWATLFVKPTLGIAVCQDEKVRQILIDRISLVRAVQPSEPFDGMWNLVAFQAMERAGLPILDVRDNLGRSILHAMLEYQTDPRPALSWALLVRPELLIETDTHGKRPIDHLSDRRLTKSTAEAVEACLAHQRAHAIDQDTVAVAGKKSKPRL